MSDTLTFYLGCASLVLEAAIPEESETLESNWRVSYTRFPSGRVRIDKLESKLGSLWLTDTLPSVTVEHLREQIRRILDETELFAEEHEQIQNDAETEYADSVGYQS